MVEFQQLQHDNLGGLCVLVYGDTGVGKTMFSASAYRHPALGKVGILDTDGGLTSISHWNDKNLLFASAHDTASIEEVALGAISNRPPYNEFRTWVVDSVSKWITEDMREISEREYKNNPSRRGTPDAVQIQDYKEMTARISRLADGLKASRRNVIFTASLADIGATLDNPNYFTERRPHMPNAIWKSIAHMMDAIWWIYQRPDGGIYMLTRPVVLPNGGAIRAKTRNTEFEAALLARSEQGADGKQTGIIKIGQQGEADTGQYLDFAKIYQIYLDSVSNKQEQ